MTLWAPSGYVVMMVDTRWTHVDTKVDTKIVPDKVENFDITTFLRCGNSVKPKPNRPEHNKG